MYKIVNKAMFIVVDTNKAYIKNNIKLINTTSLSHSKTLCSKVATHTSAFCLFPMVNTIQQFRIKNKRT